jgi:hypothetical protein
MTPPSPGAPILLLRSGAMSETIPRALLTQVIAALPPANASPPSDASQLAATLRRWLDMPPGTSIEKADISTIIPRLLEYAHNNPSELGTLALLSSRAGGRLRGQEAATDDDLISAVSVLALALHRFLLLSGHATTITIAGPSEGIPS